MRIPLRLALLGSLVPLAGCMTTGTNMHNDFACRAPNGTCAPMSVIDGKAVAGMGAMAQPIGGIVDPAMPREGRAVTASADGSPPGRTADRVLRVVFPAHIDASGIYHDEALLWVEHLVGDLHQPLHIGDAGDRGGNEVNVYPQSGRYPLNLHAEWDRVLVDDAIRQTPGGVVGLAAMATGDVGRSRDGSPAAWARGSWEIARSVAYGQSAAAGRCAGDKPPVDVGDAYERAVEPLAAAQLKRAGVRLAAVLNDALR